MMTLSLISLYEIRITKPIGQEGSTNYELRRPIDGNNKNPVHRTSCRAPFAAMNTLYIRAIRSTILGAIVMAALIFLPTGTLNYWQAWVFFALFFVASNVIAVYLAIYNPVLLERRMSVGLRRKKRHLKKLLPFLRYLDS